MKISVSDAGKRFNRDWIFRRFSYEFNTGGFYAITGPNGSGKSTLLQILAGAIIPSEGSVKYQEGINKVEEESVFKKISIAAPYLELIEEMTATEFLAFHNQFKPMISNISIPEMLSTVGLSAAAGKQIRYYSSGMKQRVKLAQAIFSNTSLLLLDEPCTNLDAEGVRLYHQLITNYGLGRTIIVSSNDLQEYSFCTEQVSILDYKK